MSNTTNAKPCSRRAPRWTFLVAGACSALVVLVGSLTATHHLGALAGIVGIAAASCIGLGWIAAGDAERRCERDALRALAAGAAGATGDDFYRGLAAQLARLVQADCALVLAGLPARPGELHALASSNPDLVPLGAVFPADAGLLSATPSSTARLLNNPDPELFDRYPALRRSGPQAIASLGLRNLDGELIGGLVVLHRSRLANSRLTATLLEVSGPRTTAEIERQHADQRLRDYATALEAVNAAFSEARQIAEAAAAAKSAFLANISHELRTPMTAILGFAETLGDPGTSASDRLNAAYTIRRNGKHLLVLINDVLDFSKIEAGGIMIERVECPPLEIIADVAGLLRGRAEARNLTFELAFVGPLPERIHSDPIRVRQILLNLIGNAIKFTSRGGVRLETRLITDGEPRLAFDVIDTGVGMSAAEVERLFEPFTQADRSTARHFGGTGLGLTISRRLARLLGGDVTLIETNPAVGSRFRAAIAAATPGGMRLIHDPSRAIAELPRETGRSPAIAADALAGCHVLLAEDGPDNQLLISTFLRKAGADVHVVPNGRAALEAALGSLHGRRDGDPLEPFDIVLMDMQMPEMDGYEATRTLRRHGYRGPIVALTAHAISGDRQACLDAGCDDYATKPISRARLIELVASFNAKRSGGSPTLVAAVPSKS